MPDERCSEPIERQEGEAAAQAEHPMERYLRMDRIPHIWCSTCGIGTAVSCFIEALRELEEKHGFPADKVTVTSGIGCTGRVAGYTKLDSFHTTHGRAIPFATGLLAARPDLKHVVFSGDGDLLAIGGNHFLHAARRNQDLKIFLVNNFLYAMTGGQVASTTPLYANCSTSPYGNFEQPLNVPLFSESCGAVYVARWTSLHVRRLKKAYVEALLKPGFSVVEAIAPCSTLYARRNRLGDGLALLRHYHENSRISHLHRPLDDLELSKLQGQIICGKFVDRDDRPTFQESQRDGLRGRLGDKAGHYDPEKAMALAGWWGDGPEGRGRGAAGGETS